LTVTDNPSQNDKAARLIWSASGDFLRYTWGVSSHHCWPSRWGAKTPQRFSLTASLHPAKVTVKLY